MPELPEVEVLVRHLVPILRGKTIRAVTVRRSTVLRTTAPRQFKPALRGAKFTAVSRRGKYLVFELRGRDGRKPFKLLGHLGMTGRIYFATKSAPLPRHAAVVFDLGRVNLVYEDTRYFGRLSLDTTLLARLGPEPLGTEFTTDGFAAALKRSAQAIKVKLLDQGLLAGIGNIYASEALHLAAISPRRGARSLRRAEVARLRRAIRKVLANAIRWGSTVPLNFAGHADGKGLFYYGRAPGTRDFYDERLRVYDRAGRACPRCGGTIRRMVQAGRSTYFCNRCQC